MEAPNAIPVEEKRGETTLGAYNVLRSVGEGDKIRFVVKAESEGNGIEECDDRREGWVGEVVTTEYDSRKNLHTVSVKAHSEYNDEGTGKIKYHTDKSDSVRNATAANCLGSAMRFDAPVDIFRDDRERTVVKVETC